MTFKTALHYSASQFAYAHDAQTEFRQMIREVALAHCVRTMEAIKWNESMQEELRLAKLA